VTISKIIDYVEAACN